MPRAVCGRCLRPAPVGCFCADLPASAVETQGALLVLQHPHEAKRKLSTTQVLPLCLAKCKVVKTRALGKGVLDDACENVYLLYPAPGAETLEEPEEEEEEEEEDGSDGGADTRVAPPDATSPPRDAREADGGGGGGGGGANKRKAASADDTLSAPGDALELDRAPPRYVLVVIDGTWAEAREMYGRIAPEMPPQTTVVSLADNPRTALAHNLRVEPDSKCTLTALAAARAVAALETRYGSSSGRHARSAVVRAVERILSIQRGFDPAMQGGIVKHAGGKRQRVGGGGK